MAISDKEKTAKNALAKDIFIRMASRINLGIDGRGTNEAAVRVAKATREAAAGFAYGAAEQFYKEQKAFWKAKESNETTT